MPATSYTKKSLIPNEKILYAASLSNFGFVFPSLLLIIGFSILFFDEISKKVSESDNEQIKKYSEVISKRIDETKNEYEEKSGDFMHEAGKYYDKFVNSLPEEMRETLSKANSARMNLIAIFFIAIGIISFLNKLVVKISTEMTLTNKRVVFKKGFVRVNETEIPLQNIEGVKIHQTVVDRLIGKGTVLVNGIGMEQMELKNIKSPLKYRNYAYKAIDKFVSNQSGNTNNAATFE